MTESLNDKKKSYKHLLEKFPIGSIVELGRNRGVVNQLVTSSNALRAKLAGLNGELQAALKAKIESGETVPGMQVQVSVQLNLDTLGKGTLPLAGFVDSFQEAAQAADCLMAVAHLLLQADLALSSEEFSMLEITFSSAHNNMPIVTGYDSAVFA
jgi:hypothetical protein